jgi:hypothetical protein
MASALGAPDAGVLPGRGPDLAQSGARFFVPSRISGNIGAVMAGRPRGSGRMTSHGDRGALALGRSADRHIRS